MNVYLDHNCVDIVSILFMDDIRFIYSRRIKIDNQSIYKP